MLNAFSIYFQISYFSVWQPSKTLSNEKVYPFG